MNKKVLIFLCGVSLLAGACAKNQVSTTGQDAQEYIQLWMNKFHPGINADGNGLYILSDTPGTGEAWSTDTEYGYSFAYADVTIRTLSGTISSTTSEELARQLGTYVQGNYYGPKYQVIGNGYSYAGVDALLEGMRIGGTRKAVIPAWMLTTSRYNTQKEYIDACSNSTHLIYEVTLKGQTEDPAQDEIVNLGTYVATKYGNVNSVSYDSEVEADGSFFFISDVSSFKPEDAIATDATVKINYTGRLLNGTVFDTSIEKVAKDAGIYSSSRTYSSQSVTMNTDYSSITMGDSSSLISGFKGGLSLMKWKGQKATVLFTSKHGYDSSGSGSTIPGYATLIFELEILAD